LKIYTSNTTVEVRLIGEGVKPKLLLDPSDTYLDVGDALVTDSMYQTLKVTNVSELSVVFDIKMGSLLSDKHNRLQTLHPSNKTVVVGDDDNDEFLIGPPNKSGLCVFGCEPTHGTLDPGDSKEIVISFSPDHASDLFRDEMLFDINGVREFLNVHLIGRAWPSIVYVKGFDRLIPVEETLTATSIIEKEDPDKSHTKNVLLSMYSSVSDSIFSVAEHFIEVGCIKSNIQTRKSCDFTFENTKEAFDKGFSIEHLKGGVDIGVKKSISVKWTPLPDHDPRQILKSSVQLVIRGETTTTYQISLRGFVRTDLQQQQQQQQTSTSGDHQ